MSYTIRQPPAQRPEPGATECQRVGRETYAYDATRKRLVCTLTLPSGDYIAESYDSVARLSDTTLKNCGGRILNTHSYSYNLGG